MNEWIPLTEELPNKDEIVETKIDDDRGERNVADLKLRNNLWWFPDESIYVYYTPTHWRPKTENQCQPVHS